MLRRTLFTEAHDEMRRQIGAFLDREVVPHYRKWQAAGISAREAWLAAGSAGLLCPTLPVELGGPGSDFLRAVLVIEELARRRCTGFMLFLHSEIASPYLFHFGSAAQKQKYLPRCARGELLTALAITEPDSGSDIEAIGTLARADGDFYRVDGVKTHVSCGSLADLVIVAVRTGSREWGREGISLLLVERGTRGMTATRIARSALSPLDTAQITFDGCRVPKANLIGAEGMGFVYLLKMLTNERLVLAISAQAACVQTLRDLVTDCGARKSRTGSVLDYQSTRFALADSLSEAELGQSFVDRCIADRLADELRASAACMVKLRTTELLKKLTLLAVQLQGGRGTMVGEGFHAAQDLLDACAQTVWGGTSETMKEVISQNLCRQV